MPKSRKWYVVFVKLVAILVLVTGLVLFMKAWKRSVTPRKLDNARMSSLYDESVRISALTGGGVKGDVRVDSDECRLSGSIPIGDPEEEPTWDARPMSGRIVLEEILRKLATLGYERYEGFPSVSSADYPIYYLRQTRNGQFKILLSIWDEPPNDIVRARVFLAASPC